MAEDDLRKNDGECKRDVPTLKFMASLKISKKIRKSTSSTDKKSTSSTDFPIFFRKKTPDLPKVATGPNLAVLSHKMTNAWHKDVFKNNTQNARCLYIYIYRERERVLFLLSVPLIWMIAMSSWVCRQDMGVAFC